MPKELSFSEDNDRIAYSIIARFIEQKISNTSILSIKESIEISNIHNLPISIVQFGIGDSKKTSRDNVTALGEYLIHHYYPENYFGYHSAPYIVNQMLENPAAVLLSIQECVYQNNQIELNTQYHQEFQKIRYWGNINRLLNATQRINYGSTEDFLHFIDLPHIREQLENHWLEIDAIQEILNPEAIQKNASERRFTGTCTSYWMSCFSCFTPMRRQVHSLPTEKPANDDTQDQELTNSAAANTGSSKMP